MNQENKTPHNFCETPDEKCTMNYCDENGCQNRERHLVSENKKLREVLEYLIENNMCSIKGDEIAKEALKGGSDE